jgi:hypothetical protein
LFGVSQDKIEKPQAGRRQRDGDIVDYGGRRSDVPSVRSAAYENTKNTTPITAAALIVADVIQ